MFLSGFGRKITVTICSPTIWDWFQKMVVITFAC